MEVRRESYKKFCMLSFEWYLVITAPHIIIWGCLLFFRLVLNFQLLTCLRAARETKWTLAKLLGRVNMWYSQFQGHLLQLVKRYVEVVSKTYIYSRSTVYCHIFNWSTMMSFKEKYLLWHVGKKVNTLRGVVTPLFSSHFTKGNNCDFLFSSLDVRVLPKWVCS